MDVAEFLSANFKYYQGAKHWFSKAVDLRRAAAILSANVQTCVSTYDAATLAAEQELETSSLDSVEIKCEEPNVLPIFLLHGYALENAFKAILINNDRSLIASDKLSEKIKSHHLTELAQFASFPLSELEAAVLTWLTEVVIWKGRYNAPTKASALGKFWALDHQGYAFEQCIDWIDAIFERVRKVLPANVTEPTQGYGMLVRVPPAE